MGTNTMVDEIAEFVSVNKFPIKYKEIGGTIIITPMGLDISEIDQICMKFGGSLINGEIVIHHGEGR